MQILSASQLKQADSVTIQKRNILSIDLMEFAAQKCCDWIIENFKPNQHFTIICGIGNNGGDGLAIARILNQNGFKVKVLLPNFDGKKANDFLINFEKLKNTGVVLEEIKNTSEIYLQPNSIVIDAIFGIGIKKNLEGFLADLVLKINESQNYVIAIDVPSGLHPDKWMENTLNNTIKADFTLTFHAPKLSFLFPETGFFVGNFQVLDIGLIIEESNENHQYYFVDEQLISNIYKKRPKFSHKGLSGHSLIIGGSKGKFGAALMAAAACLKSGSGLTTIQIPSSAYPSLVVNFPELMVELDSNENYITEHPKKHYSSYGFGPGIGLEQETANVLKFLIHDKKFPLVIDADGLNILSENKTWLNFLYPHTILTPHLKEFEKLAQKSNNSFERLNLQIEFSKKYKVITVLKGAHTSIVGTDGNVFFNSTGNAGLAKGGSGDVLTGIITALNAQNYHPQQSAILGVYIHGLAADMALENCSIESMLASDVINNIGKTFKYINSL